MYDKKFENPKHIPLKLASLSDKLFVKYVMM